MFLIFIKEFNDVKEFKDNKTDYNMQAVCKFILFA